MTTKKQTGFKFRTSGTDHTFKVEAYNTCIFINGNITGIQYISLHLKQIVLMPNYKPVIKDGYIDIIKE